MPEVLQLAGYLMTSVCPSLDPLGRSGLEDRLRSSSGPFRAQAGEGRGAAMREENREAGRAE
jgi:hypothetical protein